MSYLFLGQQINILVSAKIQPEVKLRDSRPNEEKILPEEISVVLSLAETILVCI